MSFANIERVKRIRTKDSSNNFNSGVPIGTDGLLVDMISELDLEEEIRLGGNHYVTINLTNIGTEITEWYFSLSKGSNSIEDMINSGKATYKVFVSIDDYKDTPLGLTNQDGTFITKSSGGDIIVTREKIEDNLMKIYIALYIYYEDNNEYKLHLLHSKTIFIYESSTGNVVVDEQVDNINSLNPFENENGGNEG